MTTQLRRTDAPRRRGITLIEAVIAMGMLATFLAALVPVLAAGGRLSGTAEETRRAHRIAEAVVTELARLPYEDPTHPGTLGRESGEGTSPADWDDIDDADGWSGTPAGIDSAEGWVLHLRVSRVQGTDPAVTVGTDEGLKRVDLLLSRHGRERFRTVFLRGRLP